MKDLGLITELQKNVYKHAGDLPVFYYSQHRFLGAHQGRQRELLAKGTLLRVSLIISLRGWSRTEPDSHRHWFLGGGLQALTSLSDTRLHSSRVSALNKHASPN